MKHWRNKKTSFLLLCRLWILVWRYQRFVVTTHLRPDGDAVGSGFALTLWLRRLGKEAYFVLEEPLDEKYSFLSSSAVVMVYDESISFPQAEVAFVLDSGDLSRLGKIKERLSSLYLVNIDHHKDNTLFGDLNWVDPTASSVGEILLRWIGWWVSGEISQALFLSIAADTGFFRFSNASPKVYRQASFLLERGASQTLVYEKVYQNKSYGFLLLVGKLIHHLELHQDGRLALAYISYTDMEEVDCYDTEGLLDYLALIEGVEIYVLLKEKEPGHISISFRTKKDYDISILASEFGGGGHAKASGCYVEGDIQMWKNTILEATVRYMERFL